MWVLYLEGGLWCWDAATCGLRQQTQPDRMGSSSWSTEFAQHGMPRSSVTIRFTPRGASEAANAAAAHAGLLSGKEEQTPFYNANVAFVPACTSDSWAGDNEYAGFQFRGHRVVSAVVEALLYRHGMSVQPSARLLLGGCSSGGNGAMFNLDLIAAKLPASVQLRGMFDGASWVDVPPLETGAPTLQEQTQLVMAAAKLPVPAYCLTAFEQGGDLWKCIWPSYRLPLVQTPFFLNAFQFDVYVLMEDLYGNDSTGIQVNSTAQVALADKLQAATLNLFGSIEPYKGAVYSSSCLGHCLTISTSLATFTVNNVTMLDALRRWYFAGDAAYRNVQECTGWDCTNQCSGSWTPVNEPCPRPYHRTCRGSTLPAQAPPSTAAWPAKPWPSHAWPLAGAQSAPAAGGGAGVRRAGSGAQQAGWPYAGQTG